MMTICRICKRRIMTFVLLEWNLQHKLLVFTEEINNWRNEEA